VTDPTVPLIVLTRLAEASALLALSKPDWATSMSAWSSANF